MNWLELRAIIVAVTIAIMLHVIHGAAIAFLEALAELAAIVVVDRRVLIHLVIVGIGLVVIHVVAASSFHALAEPLPLRVAIGIRCTVPVAIAITVAILILILVLRGAVLRSARGRRWFLGRHFDRCWRGHAECKS